MGCKCGGRSTPAPTRRQALKPTTQRPVVKPSPALSLTGEPITTPFNPGNMNDDERRIQQLRREAIRRSLNK